MGMLEWAEKEVEIACKREAPDRKEGEWDYGCACYESALKAYKSLMEDGHSGMSICFTQNILNSLIDGRNLTPIEDAPDVWNEIEDSTEYIKYQCKRNSALFKYEYKDGHVEYKDVDRVRCFDKHTGISYSMGLVSNIVNEMFPISMPYHPSSNPFKVCCEDFLTDEKNGDFDTVGILYVIKPDGERVEINRYFKDAPFNFEEIDKEEYNERKNMDKERRKS